jgi:hypothetical protein
MKTRYWSNDEGNNGVQFRNDASPMVWIATNIGWLPISNSPEDEQEAEAFAEKLAKGYGYDERSSEYALYMAGAE